jgi:flagellar protein FliO/FliZ
MAETAYLRMVLGLVVVVGAILACAWLARRSGLLKNPRTNLLRLVGGLSLGPRQRIAVVEVEGTWLVVGITAGQMTLLHSLPATPDDVAPAGQSPDPLSPAALFASKLGQALRRR